MSVENSTPVEVAVAAAVEEVSPDRAFSASKLFVYIKNAISSIPVNETLFKQSITAIEQTTAFINKNTSLVVVFDETKLKDLMTTIDETIATNLVKVDDGFDDLRAQLRTTLGDLTTAIDTHKKWAQSLIAKGQDAAAGAASTAANAVAVPSDFSFSTAKLFSLMKNALASIPINQAMFDYTISSVDHATQFINKNTNANLVFDIEKLQELIATVDEVISQNLVKLDDGFDQGRVHLSESLQSLKQAAVAHKEWAQATAAATHQTAVQEIQAKYNMSRDALTLAVNLARENISAARSAITNSDKTLQQKVMDSAMYVLGAAQPYVQEAYQKSQPVVAQALDKCQPILDKSKPYVDEIVEKASEVTKKLQEHEKVGSYVTQAVDTTSTVFERTKEYVGINQEEPVAAAALVASTEVVSDVQ